MPRRLHLDFETFSKADLKAVGAYHYAFDESTEILCAAMAVDDREPIGWHPSLRCDQGLMNWYWDLLEDPSVEIWAHNAMFEMAICQALLWKTWGIRCPDLSRFRCTMSLARRAALPAKLETLAEVLKLQHLKDNRGKALIKMFSMMQPAKKPTKAHPDGLPVRRIRPEDEPEAFAEFMAYCRQDVRVEQAAHHKLAFFDEPINNASYALDAVINARGVTVNLSALRHAQKLIDEETEIVSAQFRQLTGFEVTQNAVLLDWIKGQGFEFDNLQAETVDTWLAEWEHLRDDQATDVLLALRMKQSIAYASIKKVATMLECAGPHDNRIRGMLNHHGTTPGRWTASLVQFQNMKRSVLKDSADAYQMICGGCSRDDLEICHGPVLEVIGSCIRHFVHDRKEQEMFQEDGSYATTAIFNNPLLDADYAAIQARVVCWLSGQEDALEEYRQGVDRYVGMASMIYQIPSADVNKFPQRFIGKQTILGCGFGMGRPKFRATCEKLGYKDMPVGLEDTAVDIWRFKHKKVVQYWYDVERWAKKAILNKRTIFCFRRGVHTLCKDIGGIPFLLINLPSGRNLAYPHPRIKDDRIVFFGHILGTKWGDVETWGGKLVENITMGVEADIMFNGLYQTEAAGYETMTCIHDQAIAYHKPGQTPEEFVRLLTTLPTWADGLPIAAEGGLIPFYRKD